MDHLLAPDAVSAREMRELDIRTAEIANHVFVFLARASALHHDVVAWLVIAAVVANDRDDGDVVSRHGPKRIRLSEKKTAISLKRDYLIIRTGQFHSNPCPHAPAQPTATRAANFCFLSIGYRNRARNPVFGAYL